MLQHSKNSCRKINAYLLAQLKKYINIDVYINCFDVFVCVFNQTLTYVRDIRKISLLCEWSNKSDLLISRERKIRSFHTTTSYFHLYYLHIFHLNITSSGFLFVFIVITNIMYVPCTVPLHKTVLYSRSLMRERGEEKKTLEENTQKNNNNQNKVKYSFILDCPVNFHLFVLCLLLRYSILLLYFVLPFFK